MAWTDDDTKDVLKKVLGALIAAAILAMVYAILEEMPWYVAMSLGLGLIALIAIAVWRLGRQQTANAPAKGAFKPDHREPLGALEDAQARSEIADVSEPRRDIDRSADNRMREEAVAEYVEKAAKKAAKAEQKQLKKEAKSREKSSKE